MTPRDKLLSALVLAFCTGLACVAIGAGLLSSRLGLIFGGAILCAFATYLIGLVWQSRP